MLSILLILVFVVGNTCYAESYDNYFEYVFNVDPDCVVYKTDMMYYCLPSDYKVLDEDNFGYTEHDDGTFQYMNIYSGGDHENVVLYAYYNNYECNENYDGLSAELMIENASKEMASYFNGAVLGDIILDNPCTVNDFIGREIIYTGVCENNKVYVICDYISDSNATTSVGLLVCIVQESDYGESYLEEYRNIVNSVTFSSSLFDWSADDGMGSESISEFMYHNLPSGSKIEQVSCNEFYLPNEFDFTVDSHDYIDGVYYYGKRFLIHDLDVGTNTNSGSSCLLDADYYDYSEADTFSELKNNDLMDYCVKKILNEMVEKENVVVASDESYYLHHYPIRCVEMTSGDLIYYYGFLCRGKELMTYKFMYLNMFDSEEQRAMMKSVIDSTVFSVDAIL